MVRVDRSCRVAPLADRMRVEEQAVPLLSAVGFRSARLDAPGTGIAHTFSFLSLMMLISPIFTVVA